MLTVVTFRWGDKYSAKHVNTLRAMVRRHLDVEHRFVCITDNMDDDYEETVELLPLWNDFADMGRCYRRLKLFDPKMEQVLGKRFLHIDLDTVIVDDITDLVCTTAPFKIWNCHSVGRHGRALNPSLMLMNAGEHGHIYHIFQKEREELVKRAHARGYTGSDQAVIGHMLTLHDVPTWTEQDGVLSFRDNIKTGKQAPKGAKLVGFYGKQDPKNFSIRGDYRWVHYHWRALRMDVLQAMIEKHGWTRGAELGVMDGQTLFYLLERCPDLFMYAVDHWKYGSGPLRTDDGYRSYRDYPLERYREYVLERARRYEKRCTVLEMDTTLASIRVPDESLDFVFIDADHTEDGVATDIFNWAQKVKPSGRILGHDIHFSSVKAAVERLLPAYTTYPNYVWGVDKKDVMI